MPEGKGAGTPRLLWEIAVRSFRRAARYRTAAVAGVFVNTIFGYLRAAILLAVAATVGGTLRGLDQVDLATFVFISQGFIMVVGIFGERELSERIRTGDIVIDLYRPVDLQLWWLAIWLGRAAFQVLARGIPPVLLGALAFDLRWPDPWWHWLIFAASVLLASIVGFGVRFCSNLVAFWLLDNRGVEQMVTVSMSFFTGLLLPIDLFPPWLERVARILPFASMLQLPADIYLGREQGWGLAWLVAQQLAWALVILAAGRAILASATHKVVVQGG